MDFDDIIKIVDQLKVLEARLATVEAERDTARAKRDAALAEVAHMKREQQAMIMQHRHDIRDLGELLQDERCKVATVEAAWYTSQSGEARAVEALRRCYEGAARQLAEPRDHDDDQYALTAIATDCEAVLADSAIALDWLAQQRAEAAEAERRANTDVIRSLGPAFCDFFFDGPGDADYLAGVLAQQRSEAAAEALEEFADDADGIEELITCNIRDLRSALRTRAAALRAGEVGNE